MVIYDQPQPVASSSAATQQAVPTNIVVSQAPPVVVVNRQGGGGCDCSVPPDTTQAVKATRWSSIAVIVTHGIALLALGFFNWAQWIASLLGIIMGSVLLCNFNRCCYITASVLFSVSAIFDIIAAIIWLAVGGGGLSIPPFLGAVACLIGAITACIATCSWNESGAPDVTVAKNGPVQVAHPAAVPSTNAAAVQPNYGNPVAFKRPPPAYASGV